MNGKTAMSITCVGCGKVAERASEVKATRGTFLWARMLRRKLCRGCAQFLEPIGMSAERYQEMAAG